MRGRKTLLIEWEKISIKHLTLNGENASIRYENSYLQDPLQREAYVKEILYLSS